MSGGSLCTKPPHQVYRIRRKNTAEQRVKHLGTNIDAFSVTVHRRISIEAGRYADHENPDRKTPRFAQRRSGYLSSAIFHAERTWRYNSRRNRVLFCSTCEAVLRICAQLRVCCGPPHTVINTADAIELAGHRSPVPDQTRRSEESKANCLVRFYMPVCPTRNAHVFRAKTARVVQLLVSRHYSA